MVMTDVLKKDLEKLDKENIPVDVLMK